MKALDMITCKNSSSNNFFFWRGRGGSLLHILDQCFESERSEKKKKKSKSSFEFQKHLYVHSVLVYFIQNLYFKLYPLTSVFNRQANL